MICILHGYLLEGSGSNLWTRSIVESLCRRGETVHLMAQENHPDRYPFIAEARHHLPGGGVETRFRREVTATPGRCILHQPELGDVLPVYVWDRYEEFDQVIPMVDLTDAQIEDYVARNVRALTRIVEEDGITAIHANHAVLMPTVAQRVSRETGVPFTVMPHGSALEFAVKRDARYLDLAVDAFTHASRVFVHGAEMRARVRDTLGAVPGLEAKFSDLHLGVDTAQFTPVARAGRRERIGAMTALLAEMPRGKSAAQTADLRVRLDGRMDDDALRALFTGQAPYDAKLPDADLESRLGEVAWESDATLLFVGRLISTKGIQGVVAALPLLLRERPDLRLLVVGHGPLREPLEAMLWALEHGERALFERMVALGRELEGAPQGDTGGTELTQVARFLDGLREGGTLDDYYAAAREHVRPERVVFTGYLTHRELRFLFPCCDVAVFPSVVKEAGPLVFLEALASGAFPMGTYFAGMRASIDSVAEALPPGDAEAMKLSPDAARTVADLVARLPAALALAERHKDALNRVARERFDWASVAGKLAAELHAL